MNHKSKAMKTRISTAAGLGLSILLACLFIQGALAQGAGTTKKPPVLEIYYFHPIERCPIDQSIEEITRRMMQTDFAGQIKSGVIRFQVLNTDDKANAKTVSRFEMNAQALYLVYQEKGKEVKKDLTEFAFSTCQNNPAKFKSGLKMEILGVIGK
jgi:hypothetical protein